MCVYFWYILLVLPSRHNIRKGRTFFHIYNSVFIIFFCIRTWDESHILCVYMQQFIITYHEKRATAARMSNWLISVANNSSARPENEANWQLRELTQNSPQHYIIYILQLTMTYFTASLFRTRMKSANNSTYRQNK